MGRGKSDHQLELTDDLRPEREREHAEEPGPDDAPQSRPRRQDEEEQGREPLQGSRERPHEAAQARSHEVRGPDTHGAQQRDVAGVEGSRQRDRHERDEQGRGHGVLLVGPGRAPDEDEHVEGAVDEPGRLPRQGRPRREERQGPRPVDVGHVRRRRVERVASAEPEPHTTPVGARVGTHEVAARHDPDGDGGPADHEDHDGRDPHRVPQAAHVLAHSEHPTAARHWP